MTQSALRDFAQSARRDLLRQVEARLNYWIGADGSGADVDTAEHRQFAPQIKELQAAYKREGREALVERVAYTWFNRLAALRFMDANGYHPFGAKVVMPATANETMPDVLQQARAGVLDPNLRSTIGNTGTFDDLLAGRIPGANAQAEAYRMLVVAACNYYQRLMPFMFEKIGDATELLLPEDLLTEHSIAHAFRTELTDADCRDVEVIGWLYQFYISEKKAEVMGRKGAVPKNDIPAVTQLFTPHWIVRYLVENSLGRLWLLNRPNSRLREQMPYYIDTEPETDFLKINTPEDIKLIDPACGSGHMLTYAYDLLYAIYAEEGYDAPEIPGMILRNNLYGVEICDRAAALAAFALCMKARGSDNRFFRRIVQPNVIPLQDVHFEDGELKEYIRALDLGELFKQPVVELLHQFEEAKSFGSLIQPCLDAQALKDLRRSIESKDLGGQLFLRETHGKVMRVLEQAEYLCQRHHVLVTNPPYMGGKQLNPVVKTYARSRFPCSWRDTFAMFIERGFTLIDSHGLAALVTMESWMFLSSFEALRLRLVQERCMVSAIHMPYLGRGGTSMGINFGTTAAVFAANPNPDFKARFMCVRFFETDDSGVPLDFPVKNERYALASSKDFERLPGAPISYWITERMRSVYDSADLLGKHVSTAIGLNTGDNERFLRIWSEVGRNSIDFSCSSISECPECNGKWFPYNKGGAFRKWSGNRDFVINWEHDGEEVKSYAVERNNGKHWSRYIQNLPFMFRAGVTWTFVSSASFGVRMLDSGFMFDVAGSGAFSDDLDIRLVLAFLCSPVALEYLKALNPTLNFQAGNLCSLPFPENAVMSYASGITAGVRQMVSVARADWDNFETSWEFADLPLLRAGEWRISDAETGKWKAATLEESWNNWKVYCAAAIRRMQELETENNRLFIEAYGLQDELTPDVPEDQITMARADAKKDMAAFISYAVGCMFGRYSLDKPGLILADAGATVADYHRIVGESRGGEWAKGRRGDPAASPVPPSPHLPIAPSSTSFPPDHDGILPVLEGEWFTDDIVARFREFLKVTFGAETLDENVAFIEKALGKNLRKYFVRNFYKNHYSNERAYGYKKRPIYWMFSSPKGSFQALIYMHRYTRDTVNLLLNEYVREFLHKLEARQRQLEAVRANEGARAGDRTKAVKELGKIASMLKEVRGWERDVLLPLAQQRVDIDLDDGVKVNYQKFTGAVAPIAGLVKKGE